MVGGDGASRPPCARTLQYGGTGSGQPLGTDRRCQVLRPGTPASLAGECPLPRMRQQYPGFTHEIALVAKPAWQRCASGRKRLLLPASVKPSVAGPCITLNP